MGFMEGKESGHQRVLQLHRKHVLVSPVQLLSTQCVRRKTGHSDSKPVASRGPRRGLWRRRARAHPFAKPRAK
eukprot:15298998-Alexandrium_andersonii.AAC.1